MNIGARVSPGVMAFLLGLALACALAQPAQAFHFPWDQSHDTTDWEDPEDPGPCDEPDCDPCKSTGSPVYAPTGHLVWTETDIALSGRPELELTRTYNSFDPRSGSFGNGWTVGCETAMFSVSDGTGSAGPSAYVLRLPNGKRYEYTVVDDGTGNPTIQNPPGRFEQVVPTLENGEPTIHLVNLDGSRMVFGDGAESGRLLREVDRNGNAIVYDYAPSTRLLSRISDGNGRYLQFTYNVAGRVATVTDHAGRIWSYAYDMSGNLVSMTDPLGAITAYQYSPYQPPGDGHVYQRLTRVTDPTGVVTLQVTYAGDRVRSYTEEQNTFTYAYNDAARSVSKTDSLGRTYTYLYDARGLITRETDPLGYSTIFAFDDNARVLERVEKTGEIWRFTYDEIGRQLTETNPLGELTTWEYAGTNEEPVRITTAGGRVVQYVYDGAGNLVSETDPEGAITAYEYSAEGDLVALVDALGHRSEWSYSPAGLVATFTDAVGDATAFDYDAVGNLIEERAPLGRTLTFAYDAQERVTRVTNALGQPEVNSYDPAGRLTSVTSSTEVTSTFEYDGFGRLTGVLVDGAATRFDYDAASNVTSITDPEGVQLTLAYDALDRLVETRDGLGQRETYAYDPANRPTRTEKRGASNDQAFTQSYQFDALFRLLSDVRGAGQTRTNAYDVDGDLIDVTGPLGRQTQLEYDGLSRLVTLTDAASGLIEYDYDAVGNVTALTDTRGLATTYTLDPVSQLTRLSSPDTGSSDYGYDPLGNLVDSTDSRGIAAGYAYDVLDRLTDVSLPDQREDETFDYGATGAETGRLVGFADASGSTRYGYDSRDNLAQKSTLVEGMPYTVAYDHDLADRIEAISYPSGLVIRYGYNSIGKIAQISATGTVGESIVGDVDYLPFGPLRRVELGSGLTHERSYDQAYRVTGITIGGLLQESYTYDAADSLISVVDALDAGRNQSFAYDALDRLTQADGAYGSLVFAYDAVGNRISEDADGVVTTYVHEATSNRLASRTTGGVTESFSYDSEGNQTSDANFQYVYNQSGRLVSVEQAGAEIARYLHNADGERVAKTHAGVTTHFVYNERGLLLGRYDGTTGAPIEEYVYLGAMPVAVIRGSDVFTIHTDRLGTPRLVTDASDTVVWAWRSEPFGAALPDEDVDGDGNLFELNLRFPGQYYDAETGLHYNYSRDYSPSLGRYIQSDPTGLEGGLNTYIYAFSDPINFIDPRGEIVPAIIAGGAAYARCLAECTAIDKLISELTEDCPKDLLDTAGNCAVDCLNPLNWLPGSKVSKALKAAQKAAKAAKAAKRAKQAKKARDAAAAAKKAAKAAKTAKNAKKGTKGGERAGKDFTKKGKKEVINENRAKNDGKTVCEHCKRDTVPAKKSEKGVTPPDNETQVDHVIPKSKGGDGSPENGQVLCRTCNRGKSDN